MNKVTTGQTIKLTLEADGLPPITEAQRVQLRKLSGAPDDEIDYSDIARSPSKVQWVRPGSIIPVENKQQITLRLDTGVLTFFKESGKRYQSRINAVLRGYVETRMAEIKRLRSLLWLPQELQQPNQREEKSMVCHQVMALDEPEFRFLVAPLEVEALPEWSRNLINLRNRPQPHVESDEVQERRYEPQGIPEDYRPVFEQLVSSFPDCEVWQRRENFGRWLMAAVVDRSTGIAVTVELVRDGRKRNSLLTVEELQRARAKFLSNVDEEDLSL